MLAGCASSERLAEAFNNPFPTTASTEPAASAPAVSSSPLSAPVRSVQSRPLGAPVAQNVTPTPSPKTVTAALSPSAATFGGWTGEGGSPITVGQGETADLLARRYGIPLDALVRTNGFASASDVQPGTRLVVPVYNAKLAAATPKTTAERAPETPRMVAAAPKPLSQAKAVPAAPAASKPVAEARVSTSTIRPAASASTSVAKVTEPLAATKPQPTVVAATRKVEPNKEPAKKVAAPLTLEPAPPKPLKAASAAKPEPVKVAKAEPAVVEPKKPASEPAPAAAQDSAKTNIASENPNPEFRWPARGRIIQGFKPGGNDGINIAVPEGTSVKAAENGVVAYAGELKGYGNLVMIRHPNGFVSAYANNGDIEVKRGDTVKRGQVIAKSGQSGDVASPQLHFELRKGATPVDPTQYLAGL